MGYAFSGFGASSAAAATIAAMICITGLPAYSAERGMPQTMLVHGTLPAPQAFLDYCTRVPTDCAAGSISENRVVLDDRAWAKLETINTGVNSAISPASDQVNHGVGELWSLPTSGRGDCEDYALLKRHVLLRQGWPAGALLLTIVIDAKNEGHAVLTVRSDRGDLVLDNTDNRIRLWHETGYRFLMRQSFANPMQWMALGPVEREGARQFTTTTSVKR
jgi:predicted transglutaminase-like cysteine proteinase